ncbi:MAG TPA: hypothetical protein VNW73_15440 [Ktedonobacteraceae bacterium]|nr:hypothetical protein [Ktedonobacteraceae bacterium]
MVMTPAAGRIRAQLCRLGLSRTRVKSGDPGAKSLLNIVEMKPDSVGGHSQQIRITCWSQRSIFPKGTVYVSCVCPYAGWQALDALCPGHRPAPA